MEQSQIVEKLNESISAEIAQIISAEVGDQCIGLKSDFILQAAKLLKEDPSLQFSFLRLISGADWGEELSVFYHLSSISLSHNCVLRVDLARDKPELDSVISVWPGADWLEKETFDMFGIKFKGHPNLRRILLPLDWEGYPLRKDYVEPEEYHGISNK